MVNMREWIEPGTVATSRALAAAVGGHPLVAEALARRGITQPAQARAFLDPDHYIPSAPAALPGLSRAVTRLRQALARREAICVWGDFDVDGQTATALLTSALRDLGGNVTYHVPNRETEGHGVALHALEQVIAQGAQVILTCDTGISAHDAVAFARSRGVDVVITDHHDLPPTLPDATAIVNPKLLGDRGEGGGGQGSSPVHPLHDLPGVGVAYKLAEALYSAAGRAEDALAHADLAALGIIADLAMVAGDTRYLAQLGLRSLRTPRRLGLVALYEASELDPANLTEEHIAFVLAPRLNAAGRLADAAACVELLTTADPTQARIIAADLEALNARRKFLTDRVTQEAEAQIRADRSLIDHAALVLSSPHWPPGIVGIVASRLVDRYGKPVALISAAGDGPARGSARSVEGVDISAAITATAHLLLGYGGHPMAAGFTVEAEQIPAFRRELSAQVAAAGPAGGDGPDHAALAVDAALPLSELSLELVDDLARLAPFGPGNPPLLLMATGLQVTASRNVGKQEEHRILTVADEAGHQQQVVWWSGGGQPAPEGLFDLAYVARASTYRGERRVQVELTAHRPAAGAPVIAVAPRTVETIDLRQSPQPATELTVLRRGKALAVFVEGVPPEGVNGQPASALLRGTDLVFWSAPPSPARVRAALDAVQPERVILFAVDPGFDKPGPFLRRLAGLVKHVLAAQGGRTTVISLAEAASQRETVVQLGLRWLAARGDITVVEGEGGELLLGQPGAPASEEERTVAAARLAAALEETAAFRAYFRTADKDALIRGYLA